MKQRGAGSVPHSLFFTTADMVQSPAFARLRIRSSYSGDSNTKSTRFITPQKEDPKIFANSIRDSTSFTVNLSAVTSVCRAD